MVPKLGFVTLYLGRKRVLNSRDYIKVDVLKIVFSQVLFYYVLLY